MKIEISEKLYERLVNLSSLYDSEKWHRYTGDSNNLDEVWEEGIDNGMQSLARSIITESNNEASLIS